MSIQSNTTLLQELLAEANAMPNADDVYNDGYNVGLEKGKQAEYNAFWDAYQQNGERTDYQYAFRGVGWTDTTYNPKYNIYTYTAYALMNGSEIEDTKVDIDISTCSQTSGMFYSCRLLHTIRKLIVSPTTVFAANAFQYCMVLENIAFEGTIASDISFPNSNILSADSVQSIIDHLKDLTGATAQTLTFHNDVGNKLTQAQKDAISAKNWTLVY